jgi:hypothetical protein
MKMKTVYINNVAQEVPDLCQCANEFWQDSPYPYDCPVCGKPTAATPEGK